MFKIKPISANNIPSGFNEIWKSIAHNNMGNTRINANGTALFKSKSTPVTISTNAIIGKKIVVLAMAPKNAPASGPTAGIGRNCKNPFNPKKSKSIPKAMRSILFKFFMSKIFKIKNDY